MDPDNSHGSTFLKVDEVGDTVPVADTPDAIVPPPAPVDEIWIADETQPDASATTPASSTSRRAGPSPSRDGPWAQGPQQPAPSPPDNLDEHEPSTDSISLAQLKRLVVEAPKVEPTPYAFEYQDRSSFEEELEELFGYDNEERESLMQSSATYERNIRTFFNNFAERDDHTEEDVEVAHVEHLRDMLQSPDSSLRTESLQVLLYMALGCWKDTVGQQVSSPAESPPPFERSVDTRYHKRSAQVKKIKSNIGLITRVVGFKPVEEAFYSACYLDEDPVHGSEHSSQKRSRKTALINSNVDYWTTVKLLTLLMDYSARCTPSPENVESRKTAIEAGLRILKFMTSMLTNWRWEESASAIPHVNFLSMYWKAMLLAFGTIQDIETIKDLVDADGRSKKSDGKPLITASPLDYHLFRQEIISKYPAYNPPHPLFPFEPESNSMLPMPKEQKSSADIGPASMGAHGSSILHQPVHIATPAPSPPPSPAGPGGKGIKKQNYQTNQNFPFLYPPLGEDSNLIGGKGSTALQDALAGRKWQGPDIPVSILEAAELFASRMRATRAMKQMWDERIRFMKYERGLELFPFSLDDDEQGEKSDEDLTLAPLDEIQKLRLANVASFYEEEAPELQSVVAVLLKIMLATITSMVMQPNGQNMSGANGRPQSNGDIKLDDDDHSLPVLDSQNSMRNHEIMDKAVSAVILLLLKWFKVSHVLKFEYLSQLLLDTNYPQLILKLSTYQDLERVVNFKYERKSLNFFEFCHRHAVGSTTSASDDEEDADVDDAVPPPIRMQRGGEADTLEDVPASVTRTHPPETDELGNLTSKEPVETITEFSWRTFFSNINHLRTLQKIVKGKAHRQLMMVQYKFSNVLKKALKVPQPDIRLYTLKIIKGQVPYCHRKWRQSNMRIITAIYLHCKPELRDDWLAGLQVEDEMSEALPQEQALRSLTYWFNLRNYPKSMGSDKDKARGLMEKEQDFFLRELEQMEAAFSAMNGGDEMFDPDDGMEVMMPVNGW